MRAKRESTRRSFFTMSDKSHTSSSSASSSSSSSKGTSKHSRSGSISISRGERESSPDAENKEVEIKKHKTDQPSPYFDGDPNVIEVEQSPDSNHDQAFQKEKS